MTKVLEVSELNVRVETSSKEAHILRGIDLTVRSGEVCAIVGESGSGKSTLLRALVRLLPDGGTESGTILHDGQNLVSTTNEAVRKFRRESARMIFQDPWGSMHPMRSIGAQLAESLRTANPQISRRETKERSLQVLESVGVTDGEARLRGYPHQLSGGQLQRIMIAMALLAEPTLLLCDEPTTALDVTTQATILDLLRELASSQGIAVLIATHDLQIIRDIADRVVVMYAGKIVEVGETRQVLETPRHPYTHALLRAAPSVDVNTPLRPIDGMSPTPFDEHLGCPFAPRCAYAEEQCFTTIPELRVVERETGREAACLLTEGYDDARSLHGAGVASE